MSNPPSGGAERQLFRILKKDNPAYLKNLKTLKKTLLFSGLVFGVIAGWLFYLALADLNRALMLGIMVTVVMVLLEYIVWWVLVRVTLEKVKQEKS